MGRKICLADCIGRAQKHRRESHRRQLAAPGKSKRKAATSRSNGCCIKTSIRVEMGRRAGILLTVQRGSRPVRAGAHDRWCTMRDEFASKSFLAVTVTGLVLLCSGLMAFAFT
jgi:hypothetical protein